MSRSGLLACKVTTLDQDKVKAKSGGMREAGWERRTRSGRAGKTARGHNVVGRSESGGHELAVKGSGTA